MIIAFPYALTTGGPVVAMWGWIGHSILALGITAYMAEMCSAHPGVGSVYYWTTAYCSSDKWAPVLSYVAAWMNLIGNFSFGPFLAFGFSQILSACISLITLGAH